MHQGTFVHPHQTLTVQYDTTGLDGVTPGKNIIIAAGTEAESQEGYIPPNAEGIYVVPQGKLGLIDPDFIDQGGARGDRFIPWIMVSSTTAGTVTIELVDGEDPTRVLKVLNSAVAVATTFYRDRSFRVPQGALIRVTGVGLTSPVVRLNAKLDCDECNETTSGNPDCTFAAKASARLANNTEIFDFIPRNSLWPSPTAPELLMDLNVMELAPGSVDPVSGLPWVTLGVSGVPALAGIPLAGVIPTGRYWYRWAWFLAIDPGEPDPIFSAGLYGFRADGTKTIMPRTMVIIDEAEDGAQHLMMSGLVDVPADILGLVPFIVDQGAAAGMPPAAITVYNAITDVPGLLPAASFATAFDLLAVPGVTICTPPTP